VNALDAPARASNAVDVSATDRLPDAEGAATADESDTGSRSRNCRRGSLTGDADTCGCISYRAAATRVVLR
jgi:hypothetical protein